MGSHSFAKARLAAADLWIEENPIKKQRVGGFTWVKNDKVFPAQSALINRPNQTHKQSLLSEWELNRICEGIIVGKLHMFAATCLHEAVNQNLMQ